MGSIASVNRDSDPCEVHPSEAVAVELELRLVALAAQPDQLVRKIPRTEAYGGDGVLHESDWYPAGISPWYLDDKGVIVKRKVLIPPLESDWLEQLTVTKRDLHRSATLIQKMVRGYQVRAALWKQQQSARKIQRRFRQWRSACFSDISLPAVATSPSEGSGVNRTLSADTWSVRQHSKSERDEFEFTWGKNPAPSTWSQQNSLNMAGNHREYAADGTTSKTIPQADSPLCERSDSFKRSYQQKRNSSEEKKTVQEATLIMKEANQPAMDGMRARKLLTSCLSQQKAANRPTATKIKGRSPYQQVLKSTEFGKGVIFNSDKRNDKLGRKHRKDMYPAMAPGPLVKLSVSSKPDRSFTGMKGDGGCGVRSMTLQSAEKRWIKPRQHQRTVQANNVDSVNKKPSSQNITAAEKKSSLGKEVTPELVHTVRALNAKLSAKLLKSKGLSRHPGSPVMKRSDEKSLLRAAEFRNDVVKELKHLTTAMKMDYYELMDDIEKTQFFAAQQVEAGLSNYQPQTVVLISSIIPKCEKLREAVKPGVLTHIYDFNSKPGEVLNSVRTLLDTVTPGAKAKHIAIVCKGGPGYFYLIKNTPVTPAKLRANQALLAFWRGLGAVMSKLVPGQSTIHLMESNMAGNKQGERLLVDLEAVLFAHQVRVKCPLELSTSGREMITLYFNSTKHKLWKMTRYTKLQLY